MSPITHPHRWATLVVVILLSAACAQPTVTPTLAPTATPAPSLVPTATASSTPTSTALPTATATSTQTPTPTPSATPTPTSVPTATPELAERVPREPDLPFELTVTEDELTRLVLEAAAKDAEVKYDRLTVQISPDRILLRAFILLKWAGPEAWVTVEADGVPSVEEEQLRFHVSRLWIEDYNRYLLADEVPWVTRILNESLYFLQPTRRSEAWPVRLRVAQVQLNDGAIRIEGITQ